MLFSKTKLINIMSNIPKGTKGPLKMSLEQSVHLELIIAERPSCFRCAARAVKKKSAEIL